MNTNSIYTGLPVTIFEVMSRRAAQAQAVNLGQGFPDEDGPVELRRIAAEALLEGPNQYPPMMGLPDLRQAVAEHMHRFQGVSLDWSSQTLITSGATEALSDCLNALIEPGDEVVMFEPLYDCYAPLARRAGAEIRFVKLKPPDWSLSEAALEAAFSDKTKLILLNNPMNPTGKTFSNHELELIGKMAARYDCYCVSDEVYEHLVFDGQKHRSVLSVPGLRERSVAIGSAGKTFSLTGWKVGYVTGAADLLEPISKAHQYTTFTTPPNLQTAVAAGLRLPDTYFGDLSDQMQAKRDRLASGLSQLGLQVALASGTYFLNVNFGKFLPGEGDVAACQTLLNEAGVAAVPVSAFYDRDPEFPEGEIWLRFCFCKRQEVLDTAISRIARWVEQIA